MLQDRTSIRTRNPFGVISLYMTHLMSHLRVSKICIAEDEDGWTSEAIKVAQIYANSTAIISANVMLHDLSDPACGKGLVKLLQDVLKD